MIMKVKSTHLFPICTLSLPTENTRKLYGVEQGCTGSKWVKKPELQLRFSPNRGENELAPSFIQLLIERLNP